MNDVEIFTPDPKLIKLTEKVLEQNQAVLRMNERLLQYLAAPVLIRHRPEDFLSRAPKE